MLRQGFWRYLLRKDLDRQWLEGIHHAVFGLGDSGYQKYNVRLFSVELSLLIIIICCHQYDNVCRIVEIIAVNSLHFRDLLPEERSTQCIFRK